MRTSQSAIRQSANLSIGHWIFGLQISGGERVNPSIRQSVNRQSGTGFSDCRFQVEDESIRQSVNPSIGHWIFGLQISDGGRANRQSVNRQSGTGFSDCRFQVEDESIGNPSIVNRALDFRIADFRWRTSQSVNRQSGTGFSDCRFQMEDQPIGNPSIRQSVNPSIR
jgi:hypothetical protein